MKYFSLETVEKAYQLISTQTNNKFWGILAITSSVNRVVEPSVVYHLDVNKVSTLLEEQFCLLDSVKEYSKHYTWNVLFSNRWASYIVEKLLPSTPNIYAVLIWYFRREKFPDGISVQDLLKKFLEQTNISADVAKQIFSFQETFSIQFDTEKYLESDLLNKLRTYCNSTLSYTTITAEKSFVVANPGELSRAPFVQTLYASQGIQECMIITQFNFNDLYMIEKDKNNPPHTNSSSLSLQIIYYGAPGTGKSNGIKQYFTNNNIDEKTQVIRTTFHPDSDYSTFVGAYKPTMEKKAAKQPILNFADLVDKLKEYKQQQHDNATLACTKFGFDYHDSLTNIREDKTDNILNLVKAVYDPHNSLDTNVRAGKIIGEGLAEELYEEKIVYKFVPQAFLKAYVAAWKNQEQNMFLVIEEINRGNCAQIFGDIFQLLDRNDNGESEYPIKADQDIQNYLAEVFADCDTLPENIKSGEELVLPSKLYIWATMNTSDQSLFPIDSAFKRRWDWEYVPIKEAKDKNYKIVLSGSNIEYNWWDFISAINNVINDVTSSEDKKLGYFFCKPCDDKNITANQFVNKVIFYLWNDVLKDYEMPKEFEYGETKKKEDSSKSNHMSFNDFYTDQEACIRQLMENLGVKSIAEEVKTEPATATTGATASTAAIGTDESTEQTLF